MGWGSLSNVLINGATTLQNNTTINGVLSLKNDVWHQTNDSIYRFYFSPNSTTFICSGGIATDNNLIVYSSALSGGYNVNLGILNNGNTTIRGTTNIGGLLSCPNITLGSNGKINSSDDYHYIQISQPTDTLTLQEYGTITFNIGPTKTQRAFINSSGLNINNTLNVSGTTILNNNATLTTSLNVSGITTLSNKTIINGTTQLDPKILLSGQEY